MRRNRLYVTYGKQSLRRNKNTKTPAVRRNRLLLAENTKTQAGRRNRLLLIENTKTQAVRRNRNSHCSSYVFFCCQSVGLLQPLVHYNWHQLWSLRCTGCKQFKTTQRTLFFARADMSMLDHALLKALNWLPVKDRIIFKIAIFVVRFFGGTLPPYLSSCLSVYTPRSLRSSWGEAESNRLTSDWGKSTSWCYSTCAFLTVKWILMLIMYRAARLLWMTADSHLHKSQLTDSMTCGQPLRRVEFSVALWPQKP